MSTEYKQIKIKFTCPLTGDKVHEVTIEDNCLTDTWTSVSLFGETDNYSHDLNVWADGDDTNIEWNDNHGDMHMVCLSVYPFEKDEDGNTVTDYGTYTRCTILSIEGEDELIVRTHDNKLYYGYEYSE